MPKRNGTNADRITEDFDQENRIQQIYVKRLPNSDYALKKTIAVSVTTDQSTAIARYEKLESFGFGNTVDEAVDDLLNELCDIYADLESNPKELGNVSTHWWYHLKQIIRRNEND